MPKQNEINEPFRWNESLAQEGFFDSGVAVGPGIAHLGVAIESMSGKHPKRKERRGVDRAGRTPLHYAACNADITGTRQLLESGMDPSTPDDEGWTPLHFAAQSNSAEIAELLLNAGASIDPCDIHGNTPLFKAVFNSRGKGDVIRLLRAHGANPYATNEHGISPLKLARTTANFDIRQFFVDLPEETNG